MTNLFNGIEKRTVTRIGRLPSLVSKKSVARIKPFDFKKWLIASALAIMATVPGVVSAQTSATASSVGNKLIDRSLTGSVTIMTQHFNSVAALSNTELKNLFSSKSHNVSASVKVDGKVFQSSEFTPVLSAGKPSENNSSVLKTSSPIAAGVVLQPNTIAAFDADEHARLEVFKGLDSGWDFGGGERLRVQSLKAFDRFFSLGDFVPEMASLFMSSDGNLVVNYNNADGSTVELEFLGEQISYFLDTREEAAVIPFILAGDFRRQIAKGLVVTDARRSIG